MHEGVSERHSTFRSYSGGPGSFLWEGLGLRDPKSVRGARGRGLGDRARPGLQVLGLRWDQAAELLKGAQHPPLTCSEARGIKGLLP